MYYIPHSYEDCGLMHFATSPNNAPQKRAKSHCLNKLIPLFWFIYSKQSFFALGFTRVLKKDYESHYICVISVSIPYSGESCLLVSEDRGEAKQSQIRPQRVYSHRKSICGAASKLHRTCVAGFVQPSLAFCLRCKNLSDRFAITVTHFDCSLGYSTLPW